MKKVRKLERVLKRIFDFLFALICGIIALPILLVTILVILICSPSDPPIFKQIRTGYKGKEFVIYKLRTMTNDKDSDGNLLPDEDRLKTWGKVIRKLSIDELTQIWNILRGEMSWIGPRPLLPKEMAVMTNAEQVERQSMLPGISGWEAVNEDKTDNRRAMAEYDLYYVRNWSLMFDIKILFKTVAIILGAKRADDEHRAPKIQEDEIIYK